MTQGVLPFKYVKEKKDFGSTSFGGIFLYLDLLSKMDFANMVDRHIIGKKGKQGWSDADFIIALLLLNICGGDCVSDIKLLESDSGLRRMLQHIEIGSSYGRRRKKLKTKWRNLIVSGANLNVFPSPSSFFRYLKLFCNFKEERLRVQGKSFIPSANQNLSGLCGVNQEMLHFLQLNDPVKIATLDVDATLIESQKNDALFSYKGFKGYQGFNVWWWEQSVFVHTEFRDGNVPAAFQQNRIISTALDSLPESVETVRLRADTASYQHELLKFCEKGENKRFGRIEFAIGCDVMKEFKEAACQTSEQDWKPIYKKVDGELIASGQEWAEVCYVPNAIGHSKNGPDYRYFAIRESLKSDLSEEEQKRLPFQTLQMNANDYKLFGLVSNMDWEGEKLIHWSRKRCGYSEQVHSEMKAGFAGGKLPSGKFGANAAWWWLMVLAFNLNSIMKRLVLCRSSKHKSWESKRIKSIRFAVLRISGRVVVTGGEIMVKLPNPNLYVTLLIDARKQITALSSLPSG